MNIESLLEKIDLFEELVNESGFKRDAEAYRTALAQSETQTNLITLKTIATELVSKLQRIHDTDLPAELDNLFPETKVFTNSKHIELLEEIINDPNIDTADFYNKLNTTVRDLQRELEKDETEIEKLKTVFSVYDTREKEKLSENDRAIMSFIFRDLASTKSLKSFAKALEKWNLTLHLYHQMIVSHAPEEVRLIEIENGSIDVIFELDAQVAFDLVEVFELALSTFEVYLKYKTNLNSIIPETFNNKKVRDLQQKTEKAMLDSIIEDVLNKLREQHKYRKEIDNAISNEGIDVKINQVGNHIVDQIIRGNELKLLAAPNIESVDEEEIQEETIEKNRELRDKTQQVRKLMKGLADQEIKLLRETYELSLEENEQPPKTAARPKKHKQVE